MHPDDGRTLHLLISAVDILPVTNRCDDTHLNRGCHRLRNLRCNGGFLSFLSFLFLNSAADFSVFLFFRSALHCLLKCFVLLDKSSLSLSLSQNWKYFFPPLLVERKKQICLRLLFSLDGFYPRVHFSFAGVEVEWDKKNKINLHYKSNNRKWCIKIRRGGGDGLKD